MQSSLVQRVSSGVALAGYILLSLGAVRPAGLAADQPHWGEAWTRNMVSGETNLASSFDPKTGRNIKWSAELGTETHSTPVVANGRVYIGTNNGKPRNPKHQGDRGVLMCFDENSGKFLWQLVVPKRRWLTEDISLPEDPYLDWPNCGISSPATVDGDRVYIVSNRGEVLCLDPHGFANGNDGPFKDEARHQTPEDAGQSIAADETDADILWAFDMTSGAGIYNHDGAHSSILVDGEFLYLNTGTGVDNTHKKIRRPDAPSLVVLDKKTGRLVAREREGIALNIFHCTWSAPSMATLNGKKAIFFAGGNGIVYAFEALTDVPPRGEVATLKKIWQFDPDPKAPKEKVHQYNQNRREGPSNIYSMPVFVDGQLFFSVGGDLFWGKNEAWIKCINAEGSGDITSRAQVWSHPLDKHAVSTPAVSGDLVFIADIGRKLYCLDRKSGKPHWWHELRGEIWASPYLADGKIYLGSRNRQGDFWIFEAAREKKVLATIDLGAPISATATAANGTIYIATMSRLYAVSK
jgi:outer membrane protein assembly factor BamB